MEIKNSYIFGKSLDKKNWSKSEIAELGVLAQEKRRKIFSVHRDYIINCLVRTGKEFSNKNSPYYKEALAHLRAVIPFSKEMIQGTMDIIPNLLSKSEISKRMSLEMFFPYALDNPMERHGYDGLLRALPKGVALHIGAGNVFLGILDSLVLGMLTKNVNIVKLSSSGSNFLNIFAQALKENDKENLISDSIAVLNWGGGNKELEKEILKHCDIVFVWGGQDAVSSYKQMAPVNVKVESFGPKTSFGVVFESAINKDGFNGLAEKIVKDCSMWDQSACSNMHTLYILGDDKTAKKNAKELMKVLPSAFEEFQKKLPQGNIGFDEAVEIVKSRQLALADIALKKGDLAASEDNTHWTAIYEEGSSYRISPLNRVLYVKTVNNLSKLKKELFPYKGYLQTVGIAGNINEKKKVLEEFFDLGMARFVSLGSMLEGKTGSPHDGVFPMMNLVNWIALEEKPKGDDKLIEIVKLAREKSIFYKRHFSKNKEILNSDDFRKLPLLEKSHVLENTPPDSSDLLTSKAKRGIYFASGGSTGQPKYVFYDQHEYEHTCRMLAYAYEAAGLGENDVIANLFVAGNLWSSWLSVEKAIAYTKAISVPTGSNLPMESLVKYMRDFSVTSIIGLPSFLIKMAEYAKENKIQLPINKIFYGGEYVGDEMVKFFQSVFEDVSVKSAGYATADAGVIGFQCAHQSKGLHHLFAYSQYIEFLDTQTGLPVKDGEIGELVVTCLNKRHMPIIRYRVGDLGRLILKPCSCGRKEPVFEILGRCDDRIHAGGAHIFVNDVQNAIGKVGDFSFNFQIVIDKPAHKDRVEIIIESKKNGLDETQKQKLTKKFYGFLYEKCEDLSESVKMKWLDEPKITIVQPNFIERVKRTGKIKIVIDRRIAK